MLGRKNTEHKEEQQVKEESPSVIKHMDAHNTQILKKINDDELVGIYLNAETHSRQ